MQNNNHITVINRTPQKKTREEEEEGREQTVRLYYPRNLGQRPVRDERVNDMGVCNEDEKKYI